jgi:hypothetical protein
MSLTNMLGERVEKLPDPGSAMFPTVVRLCALAKVKEKQCLCKYYVPASHSLCTNLARWTMGLQECTSDKAYKGYLVAIGAKI